MSPRITGRTYLRLPKPPPRVRFLPRLSLPRWLELLLRLSRKPLPFEAGSVALAVGVESVAMVGGGAGFASLVILGARWLVDVVDVKTELDGFDFCSPGQRKFIDHGQAPHGGAVRAGVFLILSAHLTD